ncbi:MAG: type IV pilus assembly protein PilM [Deltaproteobacteria bacterium]|nr:type IV pilus assembly protein PilM [Deltaproteobacteria bacterium]
MPETIGLDIGSHAIKLIGLKMTAQGPLLTQARVKEIPYGEQKEDVNFIAETLKALLREANLKPGKVSLIASGSGVNIRFISLPSMPKAELPEAIRWEIKSQLPFPIESAQIDFHTLGEFEEEGVKKIHLIVVACPRQLIERTLSIAQGAGLQPAHLDVAPFALWNAMHTWYPFFQEEVIALVELGSEKTGIYLFQNKILQFSREVTPAGADITHAIMEGIGSGEEPPLLYERAEKIKREIGISAETSPERVEGESIPVAKISFFIRPVLEKLAAEINRSLDYYRNQFHVERIDRLLLTGGGANLKNVASYLADELRLPVECFNPVKEVLFDSRMVETQVLEEIGLRFTAAMGVALPAPKRIELLPAKEPYWSRARLEKSIPTLSLVVTFLIFLGIFWNLSGQAAALKRERDEKIAKVKPLEALQGKLALLKDQENRKKLDLSFYTSSLGSSVPSREILKALRTIVPGNVTVTLLAVPEKAKPPKGEPKESPAREERELQIAGLAFGNDLQCLTALAQLIERLEDWPLFHNAKLIKAEENKSYNRPGIEFEIFCDIDLDRLLKEGKVVTHGVKK